MWCGVVCVCAIFCCISTSALALALYFVHIYKSIHTKSELNIHIITHVVPFSLNKNNKRTVMLALCLFIIRL